MSFLDFTPLRRQVDYGQAFDPLVQALTERAKRKAEEEAQARNLAAQSQRQQEELRFKREQEDRVEAGANRRFDVQEKRIQSIADREQAQRELDERRLANKTVLENQKEKKGLLRDISSAAAGGDFARAEMLGDYQFQDPQSGEIRGMKLFERLNGIPQPPTARELPPGAEGPQVSPEDADQADVIRQEMVDQENQRNPRLRIGGVETTQGDLRYAQGRQNAADFEGQRAIIQERLKSAVDPIQVAMLQRQLGRLDQLAQGVGAGAIPLRQAMESVEKAGIRDETEQFKVGQSALDRASLERRTATTAQGRAQGSGRNSDERLEVSRLSHLNGEVQRFQKQYDLSGDRKERARLKTFLGNNQNPIVQRAMVYNGITRGLAGEKGPLTKDDVTRVSGRLQGVLGDIENWLSIYSSGQMEPTQEKLVTDTIGLVLAENEAREATAKRAYDATFLAPTSPYQRWGLGAHIANRRRELFGDDEPQPGAQPAQPAPVQRPPAGDQTMRVMPGKLPGAAEAAAMGLDNPNDTSPLPEDPTAASIDDEQPTLEELLAEKKRRQALKRGR